MVALPAFSADQAACHGVWLADEIASAAAAVAEAPAEPAPYQPLVTGPTTPEPQPEAKVPSAAERKAKREARIAAKATA